MAQTRKGHTVDSMVHTEAQGYWVKCKCGYTTSPHRMPKDAIDAWGDHLWYMDQQNLPDPLSSI